MRQVEDYQIYIFDFDGTIASMNIDWDGWMEGVLKLMQKYQPGFEVKNIEEVEGIQNIFLEKYGNIGFRKELTEFSNKYEFNCLEIVPNNKLVDFIKETTKPIYVWTNNGTEFVKTKLKELGIFEKIVKVVGRDMVEFIKPKADGYFNYIWDGKTDKKNFVFIGNDPDNDGGAALKAGIDFGMVWEIF